MFSLSGDETNKLREAAPRRLHAAAALNHMRNHESHASEEASSQWHQLDPITPQQPMTVPPAAAQDNKSPPSPSQEQNNSYDNSVVPALQYDDTEATAVHQESQSTTTLVTAAEAKVIEYTEQEHQFDEEVYQYMDIILQEFATKDPVEFNNQIYERSSIEMYPQSKGIDLSDPDHFVACSTEI